MKKILMMAMLMIAPICMFGQKFGHINSADLLPLMPEYTQAQTDLQTLQSQFEEELKLMQTEYNNKLQEYEKQVGTLPDNIKARREQELMELQEKLANYYQQCEVNLQNESAKLMNSISTKLTKAIESVGQEGGYICIFDLAGGAVPFVSTTLTTDVTQTVKDKLGIK